MRGQPPAGGRRAAGDGLAAGGRPDRGLGLGFTLVELLVVAAALTIVLTLAVETAQYIRGQGLGQFTLDLIGRTETALEQYYQAQRCYPPDRFVREAVVPQGEHQPQTEGIESLVRALGLRGRPFWADPPFDGCLADTDRDHNSLDGRVLYELVDGWGRPLLYYNGYGDAGPNGAGRPLPTFPGLRDGPMRRLNESLGTRWVHNNRRPLLDSAGPDGAFGNSDDVQRIESAETTTRRSDYEAGGQ